MNINGNTRIIAHIGFPTFTFKSPMIYNPYFYKEGLNIVVIPMACKSEDFNHLFKSIFKLDNICGALITMPHKISVVKLLDELSTEVQIAGSCNAVKRSLDGKLVGDMFDGEGFIRGVKSKGFNIEGKRALIVGAGGVGGAIAASLAREGLAELSIVDVNETLVHALSDRLLRFYPSLKINIKNINIQKNDFVINATPLGMNPNDPMPIAIDNLNVNTLVGEVVMSSELTNFLTKAKAKGCPIQVGTDMLFEQIPAYLEFFDLPITSAENLRKISNISYV